MQPAPVAAPRDETRAGVFYGVAAYVWWGVAAVYFKIVREVAPLEILAHRIIWSVLVLVAIISAMRRWSVLAEAIRPRRARLLLTVSTTLIAGNWFIYIWAVTRNHMVDASLGYFMTPLVSVLLGRVFLGERLHLKQQMSVALAALAVTWLTIAAGVFPWISIALAVSFACYGLTRKIAGVASIEGLFIETALLLPLAIAYVLYRFDAGVLSFGHSSRALDLWLLAAGPITTLPLLWFASAVQRLRLATVGLLQYISPTIQFTLAVSVFGEPFGMERAIAFALIWIAIAIYSMAGAPARTAELARSHPGDR